MRNQYVKILKTFFHEKLFRRREEIGISQEAMASRTYVDLDHGKTGCSALTLALFLMCISVDPLAFLEKLRYAFENSDTKAA